MNGIGWAVKELQEGQRVQRAGWNGKGMWLLLVKEWVPLFAFTVDDAPPPPEYDWQGCLPFVAMYAADKMLVPWLCSQTDLLATDWQVAEPA